MLLLLLCIADLGWEGEGESTGEGEGVLPRWGEAVECAQGVLVGVGRGVEEGGVVTV